MKPKKWFNFDCISTPGYTCLTSVGRYLLRNTKIENSNKKQNTVCIDMHKLTGAYAV